VGGCAADLAAKQWIWSKSQLFDSRGMPGCDQWWLWTKVCGFETSLNQGALFGMGQGMALVFAGLSVLAAAGIVYWVFWVGAGRNWLLTIALGAITAGILGNLYDRLGLHGLRWWEGHPQAGQPVYAVRDFILVMIGPYHWPNFNIADSLLVGGAGLLVWHSVFCGRKDAPPQPESEPVPKA
jgi:signal peptidase II